MREAEDKTRNRFLNLAAIQGCVPELKQLMAKYDGILAKCDNRQEYEQIAAMGLTEIYRMLNIQDELTVNKKLILPAGDR